MTRTIAVLMAALMLMLGGSELFARGGGGGGGHGGGMGGAGMGRGPSMGGFGGYGGAGGRSPSLGGLDGYGGGRGDFDAARGGFDSGRSLPGDFGGYGGYGGGHPSSRQLNDFLGGDRSDAALGAADGRGGAAVQFLHNRYDTPGAAAAARPALERAPAAADRPNLATHEPARAQNAQKLAQDRTTRANDLRNDVANRYTNLNFWHGENGWGVWGIHNPYAWATWGGLDDWLGYGWAAPVEYDYGNNIYYDDGQVYYNDQVDATGTEYANQAATLAASAPGTPPEETQWMPLGVFGVTQDSQASGGNPTLFIQMSVSKQGALSGNINNQATGQTQPLQGMIDRESQRAAWTVQGQQWPVMETGVVNLTQDSAPTLVHFEDGSTQQWLLVRLNDPNAAASATPTEN